MCGNREAVDQRFAAATKLLDACSGRDAVRCRLKAIYPVEPVPYDLAALAMRIGGQ